MELGRSFLRVGWAWHRLLDRLSGGRFDTRRFAWPTLRLKTVGRRTGQPRETALIYLEDGVNLAVVASNAGSANDPAWWLNLQVAPDTTVRLPGRGARPGHARPATREERAALWPRLVAILPAYADYERRTTRPIDVVLLEPRT
jgi:deazaflavin-dependent oxidoreductase (nitroreductase family)